MRSIISYRVATSPDDAFTLSPAAFESAIKAARAHGISHLWLDRWAYRVATYVHDEFCATLATVMSQVDLVIWLPRSREDAHGQYQERQARGDLHAAFRRPRHRRFSRASRQAVVHL